MLDDEEEVSEQFIRTVAAEVKGHGEEYAKNLQEREASNARYGFLKHGVSFTFNFPRPDQTSDRILAPAAQDVHKSSQAG